LRDGSILCIESSGRVTEYDKDHKEVRSFMPSRYAEGAVAWASVQKLADGKYLLALSGSNRVVETDATGKILWEATVTSPTWASRLPNGRTLVTSVDGKFIVELDAAGKEVWKLTTPNRVFRARPY
jgi:outer membrane protein assembly factor BamB